MELHSIFDVIFNFVRGNLGQSIALGIGAVIGITIVAHMVGFHLWYPVVLMAALTLSASTGHLIYFWPFLLGMLTAFAEIISKFDDEPMKALETTPALVYHILNGLIAAFALYFLALAAGFPTDFAGVSDIDKLKYAMAAGLGAMLIMRSKLFNIKVGDDDVSFGPEQIIKIIFRFMESAIGRVRARARRDFIEKKLDNINFDVVYARSVMTLRRASRTISDDELAKCLKDLDAVRTEPSADLQIKSYELGYVMYDRMGEDFVSDLFSCPRAEWLIRAPDPGQVKNVSVFPSLVNVGADNALVRAIPFVGTKEEVVPYMAYGTNMSSNCIRTRLNWTDSAGKESLEKTKPMKCELKDYRLAFTKKSDARPNEEASPNISGESGCTVEGVLYQLPKRAADFLDQNEPGYHRIKVKVMADGKEVEAEVFTADPDKVVTELPPNRSDLASMIEGATEYGLSDTYLAALKTYEPDAQATLATVPAAANGRAGH